MSARETILGRVRAKLPKGPEGARREAVPARAPRSRLWEVSDAVLQADILREIASGDDLVSLVAESSKAVLRRVLNGAPLRPAEVYRAWCAELGAAAAQRRAPVWRNVFGALSNAARPGAPTGAATVVKNYCDTFLAAYLQAHPDDTLLPPGSGGAIAPSAQQAGPASALHLVPSDKVDAHEAAEQFAPPVDDEDDGDCPPTPKVARGGLAHAGTTALFGQATECVLQAQALDATSSRLAREEAAGGALAHDDDDDGDDVAMTATVVTGVNAKEDDDDVVYVKTTRNGIEFIVVD
jgi:hypothetical protein